MGKQYEVIYFQHRARADLPCLLFAYAGVGFKDTRIDWEDFVGLRERGETAPLNQLPILKVRDDGDGDGEWRCIQESNAISRYIAKQIGLYPEDDFKAAIADMVVDHLKDLNAIELYVQPDNESRNACLRKVLAQLPVFLKRFERMLVGSDYFCGNDISFADIALFCSLQELVHHCNAHGGSLTSTILNGYDRVADHFNRVANIGNIKRYVDEWWGCKLCSPFMVLAKPHHHAVTHSEQDGRMYVDAFYTRSRSSTSKEQPAADVSELFSTDLVVSEV